MYDLPRQVEELSVEAIKSYEKNPRKNGGAVNGFAGSIKQFGFQQPIDIDKNSVIVAGYTCYKAALKQNFDAEIHVETNGSTFETFNPKRFPALFFTVSPKSEKDARSFVQTCLENDFRTGIEIKIVSVPLVGNAEEDYHNAILDTLEIFDELPDSIPRFIQPCDFRNEEQNEIERTKCIILVKCHPKWRLSLQVHKILNIR